MVAPLDCRRCPLSGTSVFSDLPPPLRDELNRGKVDRDFGAGETLFHEGTPANNVFCLQSGLAKVYRSTRDGKQLVLRLARPGDMAGTSAVLEEGLYDVSVQALRTTRACIIPGGILRQVLDKAGPAAARLVHRLVRTLMESEERRVSEALRPVSERAAGLLLDLVSKNGGNGSGNGAIGLPIRRNDMADMIATTPETLSRVLHDFGEMGLIEVTRDAVRILDAPGLRRISE